MASDGQVGVELTERPAQGGKPRPPRLDGQIHAGPESEESPGVEAAAYGVESDPFDRRMGRNELVLAPDSRWRKVRATVKATVAFSRVLRNHLDYGNDAVDSDDEDAWSERFKTSRIIGKKPWWVMLPTHPFRRLWEPTMILPLLYVAVVAPIRIFFQPVVEPWMDAVDWGVTAAFWVDIFVNFCSSFIEQATDRIVVDPGRIAKRYILGWFIVDLVASIPLDVIITDDSAGAVGDLGKLARLPRSLRLLRLLRLLRALRLVHLQGHLRRVERSSDMHPAIARIFMITFWAFVLLHFSGSIWWFIGAESAAAGIPSWVADQGLQGAGAQLGTQYLASVYFVIVTLTSTGYGEIIAINDWERVFTSVMMLLGLAWAGVVVSSVNTVMMNFDRQSFDVRQKLLLLDSFMRSARLPRTLKRRVSNHLESAARGEQARANAATTRQVLDMLSPALRQEVVLFTNRRQLQLIPLLQDERREVQSSVLELLSRQVSSRGDYVSVEGTYASSIFFLTSGRANVLQAGDRIASLGSGSYFGLIDCLFSSLRLLSVQAVTDCELYSLRREDLMTVLGQHPEFALRLKRRALARLTKFRERVGRDVVEPQFLEQMQHFGIGLSSAIADSPASPGLDMGPWDDASAGSAGEVRPRGGSGAGFEPLSPEPVTPGVQGVAGTARRRRRRGSIQFVDQPDVTSADDDIAGATRAAGDPASRGDLLSRRTTTASSAEGAGAPPGDDGKAAGRGPPHGWRRGAGAGAPNVTRRTSGRVPSHRSFASAAPRDGSGLEGGSAQAEAPAAAAAGRGRFFGMRRPASTASASELHEPSGPLPDTRPLTLDERLSRAKAAARAMGDLPPGRMQQARMPVLTPPPMTAPPGGHARRRSDGGGAAGGASDAGGEVREALSAPGPRIGGRGATTSDESDVGVHEVRSWRGDDEDAVGDDGGRERDEARVDDVIGVLGGSHRGPGRRALPRLASAPGRHMWPMPQGSRGVSFMGRGGDDGGGAAARALEVRVEALSRRLAQSDAAAAADREAMGGEVGELRRQTDAILEAVRALAAARPAAEQ